MQDRSMISEPKTTWIMQSTKASELSRKNDSISLRKLILSTKVKANLKLDHNPVIQASFSELFTNRECRCKTCQKMKWSKNFFYT